ncbi:MAG: hypothetical protein JW709_07245 [Sedimentisphaerales bacterium]|nr:hypothetical protein [Sedimentisphaerales bacterium]
MMSNPTAPYLVIPRPAAIERNVFIDYWAGFYDDPREQLYEENIQGNLTATKVRELFKWKSGNWFPAPSRQSMERNFIPRLAQAQALATEGSAEAFLKSFPKGGAIWRIFFLHICRPDKYPIFDQHVYRAMIYIQKGDIEEIPNGDKRKIAGYLNDYLPFFKTFGPNPDRRVDKALWMLGRFLKSPWATMILPTP